MRLKSVFIRQYKNLKDFSMSFDGTSFIDVFVGKNGSGKSNLFEALIEIFRHLYEFDNKSEIDFDFTVKYEIDGTENEIVWRTGKLSVNGNERKNIGDTPLPDNVLIYYSGHNDTVSGLIQRYEADFRKRIKGANPDESRRFIGIGPEYKQLLLAVLLLQPAENTARQFICQKLGIKSVDSDMRLTLQRPAFAAGALKALNMDGIENFDPRTHYWGADGITREFLNRLVTCVKGEFNHGNVYNSADDHYRILINIELFHREFAAESVSDIFRQFDNLKTLGMLEGLVVPLALTSGLDASISHFSDGQFQSVYIYSIVELFKDRNCLILLDEPDAFLHPEWQFDFLRQVFEITDAAAKTCHVLMSSHSASTITCANDSVINLFEFDGEKVALTKVNKSDIIKSLSAGLITFSESEARLNIQHVLKNTSGPVLFTEGITDEMILETAWQKLYPAVKRPFEIQNAFSCGFQRNLVKDNALYQNHPDRTFFALFDFDEAYNDWNQLGQDVQTDPTLCLTKKRNGCESYALLLPVPTAGQIRGQVINPRTGGNFGNKSLLTIELLFHGVPGLDAFFTIDTERTDGFIKFISDGQKTTFAQDVVPGLDAAHFSVFRHLFNFIKSKCAGGAPA
ncbi:ATP-dependent nuclease [Hydrogenophaga sp. BPS33]|uniref:ATP-dependent nuclease n=1 Tax=Hydrogenophaga sp. BPS33 TaxID=2651974 RepID=UPI00131F7BB2|nr:AAA family ATPase [Hydrogenophaga sp. BPS33]QHE85013.1 AAA family ATPase [Hydrogenophaga sp. BPS33]